MARPTAPRVDAAERDAQALALRAAGMSFRQVGRVLGCSSTTAFRRVSRGLDRTRREPADQLRTLELHRLDQLQAHAAAVLRARHVVIQAGRVIVDDTTGRPYTDHGPALAAVATLLRIAERRAKLVGLDAPTKVEAQVALQGAWDTLTEDEQIRFLQSIPPDLSLRAVRLEIAELEAEVRRRDDQEEIKRLKAELAGRGTPTAPAPDVGGLVAGVLEEALDAAGVPQERREAAYQAAARKLQEVDPR